jgi:hypothetical protein
MSQENRGGRIADDFPSIAARLRELNSQSRQVPTRLGCGTCGNWGGGSGRTPFSIGASVRTAAWCSAFPNLSHGAETWGITRCAADGSQAAKPLRLQNILIGGILRRILNWFGRCAAQLHGSRAG